MFQFSHYVDQKYPWKVSIPEPLDDSVLESKTKHIFERPYRYKDAKLPEPILIQIADTRQRAVGAQRERDFYFNKLKEIETLCRVLQENCDGDSNSIPENILSIIYESQALGRPVKDETIRKKRKNRRKISTQRPVPKLFEDEDVNQSDRLS